MNIEPLSNRIYDKAIAAGVSKIILNFSGGSDEGYLNVSFEPPRCQPAGYTRGYPSLGRATDELTKEVETWAWEVYSYSGGGEGFDYGDDITYDLVNKKVTVSEWYTARTEGDTTEGSLELESDEQ